MVKHSMHMQRIKSTAIVTFAVKEMYPPCIAKTLTTVESNPIRECNNPGLAGLVE